MRITIFALASLHIALLDLSGQITINSEDMPQPGVTYNIMNATILDLSLGDQSGENVVWDASDIISVSEAPLSPVSMSEASLSAAFAFNSPFNPAYQCDFFLPTEFPDLGVDLGIPLDGFNNFYQTDGDHYTIAGIGLSAAGFDLPVPYDDIDEILPLPLQFGDEMTSSAAFELELAGILSYGLVQERQVTVDGWGTLILPDGAYEVLRTRTELVATDDVFIEQLGEPFTIDREQITYQWWAKEKGYPLLEITEVAGLPLLATFQDFSSSNGFQSISVSDVQPFPNPAKPGQYVTFNKLSEWEVLDGSGREIWRGKAKGFNVPASLNPGMYFIRGESTKAILVIQ
ncbi:MAG: T9SS type A sorting domain-containing protein [Bacteroidetes bacterium]|nr:T9SS type A sorting domain-containing protein [Bacteroidota bacterium]MDA1336736.1 T9SS type A sorting domain-containing protein [Bacteroidota bacterium]